MEARHSQRETGFAAAFQVHMSLADDAVRSVQVTHPQQVQGMCTFEGIPPDLGQKLCAAHNDVHRQLLLLRVAAAQGLIEPKFSSPGSEYRHETEDGRITCSATFPPSFEQYLAGQGRHVVFEQRLKGDGAALTDLSPPCETLEFSTAAAGKLSSTHVRLQGEEVSWSGALPIRTWQGGFAEAIPELIAAFSSGGASRAAALLRIAEFRGEYLLVRRETSEMRASLYSTGDSFGAYIEAPCGNRILYRIMKDEHNDLEAMSLTDYLKRLTEGVGIWEKDERVFAEQQQLALYMLHYMACCRSSAPAPGGAIVLAPRAEHDIQRRVQQRVAAAIDAPAQWHFIQPSEGFASELRVLRGLELAAVVAPRTSIAQPDLLTLSLRPDNAAGVIVLQNRMGGFLEYWLPPVAQTAGSWRDRLHELSQVTVEFIRDPQRSIDMLAALGDERFRTLPRFEVPGQAEAYAHAANFFESLAGAAGRTQGRWCVEADSIRMEPGRAICRGLVLLEANKSMTVTFDSEGAQAIALQLPRTRWFGRDLGSVLYEWQRGSAAEIHAVAAACLDVDKMRSGYDFRASAARRALQEWGVEQVSSSLFGRQRWEQPAEPDGEPGSESPPAAQELFLFAREEEQQLLEKMV